MGSARFFPLLRVLPLSLLITLCPGMAPLPAQAQSVAQPLIVRPVDESSLVTLRGNVHPLARPQFDRGPAPASLGAQRQLLVLKRTPRQEMMLQQYLASLEDKNSPNFHHFLTPEQFGQQYGPATEDVAKIVSWLSGQGFSVNKVAKSNMAIEFTGSVSQVQTAFHTQIHRFVVNGRDHVANVSNPMIPSALAPVVAGVSPLNDFFPRPQVIQGPSGRWDAGEKRFVPELTLTGSGTQMLFVGPSDAATIYDVPTSLNAHIKSGQATYYGTGVTVGIATDGIVNVSNIANYRTLFALPAGSYTVVTDGGGVSGDVDNTEPTLDGEVVSAIAPGAKLVYYQAGDTSFQSGVILAILRAIDDNAINILNVSYGGCELAQGAAGNQEILNAWEQAAAQGIAVTVSSGDSGSAGCDNPDSQTVATHGYGVNGLASTPYTVAVGGTDFDVLSNSFTQYVSSTNGYGYTSALGYVPENSWNNSPKSDGALANNQAYVDSKGATNIVAGGGGASSASLYDANANVAGGYAKPLWQQQYETSAGIATDSVRDLPDISLFAANGMYRAAWALCGDGDCNGSNPTIHGIGGTSASAPAFAGVLALINQKTGATARLGQPNWILYALAKSHPEAFHQIKGGNISVVCKAGTPNCAANGFLSGYDVAGSYNLATGLGSLDVSSLVNNWTSIAKTQTTTSLTLSPTSFQHGSVAAIGISVNPSAATGNVALSTDATVKTGSSSNAQISFSLSSGRATGSWAGLPGGTYDVFANYGGDGSYSGSVSAPTQITVTPEDSILQLSGERSGRQREAGEYCGRDDYLRDLCLGGCAADRKITGRERESDTECDGNGGFQRQQSYRTPRQCAGWTRVETWSFLLITAFRREPIPSRLLITGIRAITRVHLRRLRLPYRRHPTKISVTTTASSINSETVSLIGVVSPIVANYFAPTDNGTITFTDVTTGAVLGTASGLETTRDPYHRRSFRYERDRCPGQPIGPGRQQDRRKL